MAGVLDTQNIFFRFSEVFICCFHSASPQGHQTSFCAERLDVSTREVILSREQVAQCHVISQLPQRAFPTREGIRVFKGAALHARTSETRLNRTRNLFQLEGNSWLG
ncbi:hypothetical protein QTO34_012712 [Cnephaeus nilssonii]|uniref:Uncharacterized protein n=1 Tax=Cnephaeus nilssonii TaxID=3371016 RepID=A0AA40HAR9_CNENI|nr:hypothetical protein QTO34_012712 [Eptesicus nilssonii]